MVDTTLGVLLVSSLISTAVNKETIAKVVNLLLYNASTFLQLRRKKLLAEAETSEEGAVGPSEATATAEEAAGSKKIAPVEEESKPPVQEGVATLTLRSNLTEVQAQYAERELRSLMAQLETHHRMLTIKEEQVVKFGEYAPPPMVLALENERAAIAHKLVRIRDVMGLVSEQEYPAIDDLTKIFGEG